MITAEIDGYKVEGSMINERYVLQVSDQLGSVKGTVSGRNRDTVRASWNRKFRSGVSQQISALLTAIDNRHNV